MKDLIRFASIVLVLTAFSCKAGKSTAQIQPSEIVSIQWGKSFGMCRGYCFYENTYRTDSLIYFRKSWHPDEFSPVRKANPMPAETWNSLLPLIELDSFFLLPETIGCPDCADGGAEWVLIQTKTKTHKVMFDFGSNPAGLEKLLPVLRANDPALNE